ncbi:MAG TPA: hypothetical protein VL595_31100 [Pseudonocardia sp.]|jgi:hypothetical protein|nr:hypothetical protein [Pseudonocardia sp.]
MSTMKSAGPAVQRAALWTGPGLLVVMGLGFVVLARYIPPPPPTLSPQELVDSLRANLFNFRLGMALTLVGAALLIPWGLGVAARVHAAEAGLPLLGYIQLGSLTAGSLAVQLGALMFEVCAYRLEDTDPQIVRALHDVGWFFFLAPWPPFTVWCAALTVAIFTDRRKPAGLPRWCAYLCAWTALLFVPACAIFWFKSGPLAWDGVIAFYIPFGILAVWIVGITVAALRSLGAETADETAGRGADETLIGSAK